jgi:hypothetical protein
MYQVYFPVGMPLELLKYAENFFAVYKVTYLVRYYLFHMETQN